MEVHGLQPGFSIETEVEAATSMITKMHIRPEYADMGPPLHSRSYGGQEHHYGDPITGHMATLRWSRPDLGPYHQEDRKWHLNTLVSDCTRDRKKCKKSTIFSPIREKNYSIGNWQLLCFYWSRRDVIMGLIAFIRGELSVGLHRQTGPSQLQTHCSLFCIECFLLRWANKQNESVLWAHLIPGIHNRCFHSSYLQKSLFIFSTNNSFHRLL